MKRIVFCLLIALCCLHISSQSTSLLPIVKNGKWGAVNDRGVVVIHPKFNKIECFFRNEAVAFAESKRGVINQNGEWVVNPIYDKVVIIDNKGSNVYKVWLNGKCGIVNKNKVVIISIKYKEILLQDDFYFFKLNQNWQIGKVENERILTLTSFDKVLKTNHFFIGITDESYSLVTQNGVVVETDCVYFIENNQAIMAIDSSFSPQIYLKNGESVLTERYQFESKIQDYLSFNANLFKKQIVTSKFQNYDEIMLKSVGFSGIFSLSNCKWVVKGDYDEIFRLNNVFFLAYKNGLIGVIDSAGNLKTKIEADNVFRLSNYIVWEKNEEFGLYVENFKEVLAPKMNNIILQSNNLIYYLYQGKYGIVDSKSKVVSKAIYNSCVKQGNSIKAYTDDYLVLYDFSNQGEYLSEKKYTNVVIVKTKMEFPKMERAKKDQFDTPISRELLYGWYLDSLPFVKNERPFDTLYAKKWGMINEFDSVVITPKYITAKVLSSNFSLATISKFSTLNQKDLPKVNTLPCYKTVDIIDNVSRKKINATPFYQLNFNDTNSVNFISFINKKGLGIVSANYSIIRNDISFVDVMENNATRFCTGATQFVYDTCVYHSIFSSHFWERNERVFSKEQVKDIALKTRVHFKDAKWGFLNDDGTELFHPQFVFAENFSNNVAFVCNKYWGAVSKDSIIIPLIYSSVKRIKVSEKELYLVRTTPKLSTVYYDTLAQPLKLDYSVTKVLNDGCLLVKTTQGYGILDDNKKWLLKPSLKRKPDCKDNYCIVKDQKYGVIDFEGNQLIEYKYDDIAYYLGEGLVVFFKYGKYGVGNSEGEVIIQPNAQSVELENGCIKMISRNSIKLYSLTGQLLSTKKSDYFDYNKSQGILMQVHNGKTIIKDIVTHKKVTVIHKESVRFENEILIVKDEVNKERIGAVTIEGTRVLPTKYTDIKSVGDTLLLVTLVNKVGLFSSTGKVILPCIYKKIVKVFDNYFAAVGQGKVKIFDVFGNLKFSAPGSDVQLCIDNLIMIKTLGSVSYINDKFENHFNETFFDGFPFSGKYTSVLTEEGWVILGMDGRILCAGMNNKIVPKGTNLFQTPEISYLGLYDASGKIILEPIYDKIECVDQHCIRCEKGGKIGYIRANGEWIYKID